MPLDGETRELLRRMHWRKPARDPRRWWTALTLTLLLHALLLALIVHELAPRPWHAASAAASDDVLQVRFITNSSAAAPPAVPAPPALAKPVVRSVPPKPRPAAPPRAVRTPVEPHAMTVSIPTTQPPPRLYTANGQIRLPAGAGSAPPAPAPAYVAHLPQGDTAILHNNAGDQYQARDNRFSQYFPPPGESSVDTAVRKVLEKTTETATIHLPKGVRFHCSTVLFILPAGCGGDPPSPPPSTDGDERLSMAATPLTKHAYAPKPPSVDQCIAIYRAGKPLPYGCPVDTPSLSMAAKMRVLRHKRLTGQGG